MKNLRSVVLGALLSFMVGGAATMSAASLSEQEFADFLVSGSPWLGRAEGKDWWMSVIMQMKRAGPGGPLEIMDGDTPAIDIAVEKGVLTFKTDRDGRVLEFRLLLTEDKALSGEVTALRAS